MPVFKSPSEVLYGQITKPQAQTIKFIEDKIANHEFSFECPYTHQGNFQLIKKLLEDSGWILTASFTIDEVQKLLWIIKPAQQ